LTLLLTLRLTFVLFVPYAVHNAWGFLLVNRRVKNAKFVARSSVVTGRSV